MNKTDFYYANTVPSYMIDGPHLVFFNGIITYPGRINDYTIGRSANNDSVTIYWWNPTVNDLKKKGEEFTITVVKLDTGEMYGVSSIDGVFINTIKKRG